MEDTAGVAVSTGVGRSAVEGTNAGALGLNVNGFLDCAGEDEGASAEDDDVVGAVASDDDVVVVVVVVVVEDGDEEEAVVLTSAFVLEAEEADSFD